MAGMQDKLTVPPDFDGPVRARKCTDIIFMVAIIIMWVVMTGVGISSVKEVSAVPSDTNTQHTTQNHRDSSRVRA